MRIKIRPVNQERREYFFDTTYFALLYRFVEPCGAEKVVESS